MDTGLLALGGLQIATLLLYRWVGRSFVSQPRFNHPAIFHNPTARMLLCNGPFVVGGALIVLSFFLTESPWLFLGLSVAGFIAFSARPNPDAF
jgi:hypothetical protein